MTAIIQAKMSGTCSKCGKPYPPGTRIVKDPATGAWSEADCVWPSHKGATPSNANPADELRHSSIEDFIWFPADEAIAAKVAMRLKRAKEMVDKEFPDAKGYSDYLSIVAEVAHQLFAEAASLSIQSAKERNMQQIGRR